MMACGRLREREHVSYYVLIETRFSMSSGVGATGSSSFRLVLHGSDHRCRRLLPEPLLEPSHVPIAQSGDEPLRARERQDVIPDLSARTIPFDKKTLLPRSSVIGKRPVGKAVTLDRLLFIHDVHNAASVQPPESEVPDNDRHDLPGLDRRLG